MLDFGIGYTELVVIALVAIIVIGPKDLPRVLRAFGRTTAKLRGMAREFQTQLDDAMKDTGFDEVKKEVQNLKNLNPVTQVKNEVVAEIKKQDDDFKKYFGGLKPGETSKPPETKAPELKPPEPKPEAAAAP